MIEYDDSMTDEEAATDAKDNAQFVSDRLGEADNELSHQYAEESEALEQIGRAKESLRVIEEALNQAEVSAQEARSFGDSAKDKLDEANDVVGTLPAFIEALADTTDDQSAAETVLQIGDTKYRFRVDPLNEADVDPILFQDE